MLAAVAFVPVMLSLTGCFGFKEDPRLDASLKRYRGDGFTVGYPKGWARSASGERNVPGSLFEVMNTGPEPTRTAGSFDILTYWGRDQLLDDVVSDFMRVSRTQHNFQLIAQERLDMDGHTGYQVRKEADGWLGSTSQRLHTVDWFTQLKSGTVVDIRVGFPSDHYDFTMVSSIGRSLAVD